MEINYSGYKCELQFGRYPNGNTAITLRDTKSFESITTITINPDVELAESRVAIKNYSENEGIEKRLLRENVIVGEPITSIPSGFISMPVYKLSDQVLEALVEDKKEQQ